MKHDIHYRQPFWKLALGGMIAGAMLYFFPFLVPALAFLFLAGLLVRIFFGPGHRHHRNMRYAYAARWQTMTDEQRQAMRMKFNGHRCGQIDNTTPTKP